VPTTTAYAKPSIRARYCSAHAEPTQVCYVTAMTTVYRVLSSAEWQRARMDGEFHGAEHDLRDGFIHFSSADQLAATLRAHYAGVADLVLLYVRVEAVPPSAAWRWERSRDGALFPHLYTALPVAAVHRVEPLMLDADGVHRLPELEDKKHPEFVHVDLFGGEGSVRVVNLLATAAEPFTAVLACELSPAGKVGPHLQEEFAEFVLGRAGTGIAMVDGVPHPLDAGDAVYLPHGSVLAIENRSSIAPLCYFIVKARG
jgi:uncharacterized protein (DUF952 family)/mannose-6-phosphate isomerase-like protein (cupin superfamily)